MMILGQPIRQVAYFVEDLEEAIWRHNKVFGSGPFFVLRNTHPDAEDAQPSGGAAFGQCGGVQIELIEFHGPRPPIFQEVFPEGGRQFGIHHMAIFVNDMDAMGDEMETLGFPIVQRSELPAMDMKAILADCVKAYGHFVEIFQKTGGVVGFFDMVKAASEGFRGEDLIREFPMERSDA